MLDYELLAYLFDEFDDLDIDSWAAATGYSSSWSDEQVYSALPPEIKAQVTEIVMNTSWWHEGM